MMRIRYCVAREALEKSHRLQYTHDETRITFLVSQTIFLIDELTNFLRRGAGHK